MVSLAGFAGTSSPDLVDGHNAEAVVHVAVELQQSGVVVPGNSHQFLPDARLMVVLLIFDDEF